MVLVSYITPNASRLPWIPLSCHPQSCPVCRTLKIKRRKRINEMIRTNRREISYVWYLCLCASHGGTYTFRRDLNRESKGGPFSPKRLAGKQISLWNCLICILTCSHTHTQKHLTLHHDVVPVPPRGLQALAGVRNTLQSRD